jgi:phenylpropionate dioxygenase-like ring-hydroxylating dioxygenase large terminal subunit
MTYLRNTWYMAAWSDEVGTDKPLGRTLLDTPVVFFRRTDGTVAALFDRCPHRFAPLSVGNVQGDKLVCGYHGLGFDGAGACIANPHGPPLAQLRISAYPIHEAHKAIWIWMGDAARADSALIPDLSYLATAPATAFSKGKMVSRGGYELFVDNIMDLSHTDYLHPTTLGGAGITGSKAKIVETDDHIEITWFHAGRRPSPLLVQLFPELPAETDSWQRVRWYAPGVMRLTAATAASGAGEDEAFTNLNAHIMTPETATSTHYFFAATRNYRAEDGELNDRLAAMRERIFATEDKPMIEQVQARMGEEDFWALKPVLLPVDRGAVLVRRRLKALIEAEAGQA